MWKLNKLIDYINENYKKTDNGWVPAKPLNSTTQYQSLFQRFKNAWEVFNCRADCFKWPEDDHRIY
jgi:hypothetical protein